MRIHLIGVAGSGMSGLASLLLGLGHRVSGSDKVTTVETERLQRVGLDFSCPHTAEAVEDAELVIYSSAVKKGNVAFDTAMKLGITLVRRAEALAAIMEGKRGILVAGTHGKTTTSAMAAHVLRQAGVRCSHYVGAEIPVLGTNAHWEKAGDYMVAEGDESDGTLVLFHPEHAILLNVEAEHLDFYEDVAAIRKVFAQFLDQTSGKIIYCAEDGGAVSLAAERQASISYGWERGLDYSARAVQEQGESMVFEVCRGGASLGEATLGIPGRHNVLNSLSVIALASELGVEFEAITKALGTFRGARRRFEWKYKTGTISIVDDYGHHPTEIAVTLATARTLQAKRLVCLFQPHRYTRTRSLAAEFGSAFEGVDAVFVTDVYPASEPPIPGISGQTVVDEILKQGRGVEAFYTPELDRAHLRVGNYLREGDFFLSLGAGNVHEAATRIAADMAVLDAMRECVQEEEAVFRLYEPMSRHTTLRVGGPAQFWVETRSVEGFARLVRFCRERSIPLRVIGRGSNLLVRDGGIAGVVAHPSKGEFSEVRVEGDCIVAGVGARFKQVAAAAKNAGLGGFEWMEGIPGNVGGGLRMNAGAMGSATFDQVVSVRYLDGGGSLEEKSADEIVSYYRNVPELRDNYAVSAVFRGRPTEAAQIDARMEESMRKRRDSQPVAASAGCIFKNPEECPAGRLVEELGLKDLRVGAARVSEVHGNFIVNEGEASAAEVLSIIDQIKSAAREERNIELETEVQILGEEDLFTSGKYT